MTDAEKVNREISNTIVCNVFMDFDPVQQEQFMTLDADTANGITDAIKQALTAKDTLYGSKIKELEAKIARMEGVVNWLKKQDCPSCENGFTGYSDKPSDGSDCDYCSVPFVLLRQLDEVNREEKV